MGCSHKHKVKIFYPIYPPDHNADEVITCLRNRGWCTPEGAC